MTGLNININNTKCTIGLLASVLALGLTRIAANIANVEQAATSANVEQVPLPSGFTNYFLVPEEEYKENCEKPKRQKYGGRIKGSSKKQRNRKIET